MPVDCATVTVGFRALLGYSSERLLYFQKGDTAEDVFDADQKNGGAFYSQSLGKFLFAVDEPSAPCLRAPGIWTTMG